MCVGVMGMEMSSGLNFQVASSSLTKTFISVDVTDFKQYGDQKKLHKTRSKGCSGGEVVGWGVR